MDLANIKKLLQKYFNTETSLQEEQFLQKYFCSTRVAPELEEYKSIFVYFKNNKNYNFGKELKLKFKLKRKKIRMQLSIAASLVILFTTYLGFERYNRYQQKKQLKQIEEILFVVSENLNRGNQALYSISINLNKGREAIEYLNTYEETVNKAVKIIDNKNKLK
ncbi:MAG: hypothetical protein ACK5H1_03840 [Tenacibaculum sp.]